MDVREHPEALQDTIRQRDAGPRERASARLTRSSGSRQHVNPAGGRDCASEGGPRTDYTPRSWKTRACNCVGWVSGVKVLSDGSWTRMAGEPSCRCSRPSPLERHPSQARL